MTEQVNNDTNVLFIQKEKGYMRMEYLKQHVNAKPLKDYL